MMKSLLKLRSRSTVCLFVALVVVLLPTVSLAQNKADAKVLNPKAKLHGATYGQWSAAHWQWLFSMPVDQHPLYDTAGIEQGQQGPVWFLGGTLASTEISPGVILGEVTRTGDVPSGKSLFFPMLSVEASVLEGNGTTEEELREFSNFLVSFIDPNDVFLEIDGQPVTRIAELRTESPLFTFGPLPDNNVAQSFGIPAPAGTTSLSVSDGYFAMVKPLSVGRHTLYFGGLIDLSSIGGPVFIQDIYYEIDVRPHTKK